MTAIDGFLLSRHWRDTGGSIELELWLATDHGPVRVLFEGEHNLFFLPEAQRAEAGQVLLGERGVEFRQLALSDFRGERVVGVYFRSQRTLRRSAERLLEAGLGPLEADINPVERFLMERFVNGSVQLAGDPVQRAGHTLMRNPKIRAVDYEPQLAVVSVDIETAMTGVQLYSIGVHAVRGGIAQQKVFMLGEGADLPYVVSLPSQKAVLLAFLDWLQEYDPDVLIGWNVINFDLWYLQRVADVEGVPLALGRDRRAAHWRSFDDEGERRAVQLHGRVVLDGIELMRSAFYRFESFSLNHVAGELLGHGKLLTGADRGEEIGELFKGDKNALAKYNLRDCELVWEIFEHTSLLDFALARSHATGMSVDRLGGSVATFDHIYLPRLHRSGYVAPRVPPNPRPSPGGFVLDSVPGIYEHVLVLDFKSLYPSIIRTFCIDPLGLALGMLAERESDTVPGFLEARFIREGHLLPQIIAELWQARDAAKRDDDSHLSMAIKIIMNSFYGVLGSPGCRFFDPRLATSITRRGHEILKATRDEIERQGQQVIYGDTDSVFVWVRDARSSSDAVAIGRRLQNNLNRWWREQLAANHDLDCVLELEFETHFRRFLMPTVRGSDKGSKKRYAGVVEGENGDELVFKGLENVRTDWTRLARDFQQELYRRVFAGEPYRDYVRQVAAQLRAGERDAELVYRKRLRRKLDEYTRNVPPHVQAARLQESRSLPRARRGGWVEYVITQAGAEPAAAPHSPLDYQHYIDRQLEPVADGILLFLQTSFSALVEDQLTMF